MKVPSYSNKNYAQNKYSGNSESYNEKIFNKLNQLLHGENLPDLPLDFIGTMYFSDFYKFKSILGAGSYAVVLEVLEPLTRREFAMKVTQQQP